MKAIVPYRNALTGNLYARRVEFAPRSPGTAVLLLEQVPQLQLRDQGLEHEVGIFEAEMPLCFVGAEHAAALRPCLEARRFGFLRHEA